MHRENDEQSISQPVAEQEVHETEKPADWQQIAEALEKRYDELWDKYLRLAAEFENYRKRQERIFSEMIEQERNNIIGRLLVIADDVSNAIDAGQSHSDKPEVILEGIKLIKNRIDELLRLEGISEDDPTGKMFDPLEQEAIAIAPVDSIEKDGVVVDCLCPTYRRCGKLVKPAKVIVGKYEKASENSQNGN